MSEWIKVSFDNLCLSSNQGVNTTTEKVNYTDKGIKVVRAKNIYKNKIDFDDVTYIDDATYNRLKEHVKLEKNDVLYTNIGSQLGNAAINKTEEKSIIAWNVFRIVVNSNLTTPEFMIYLLNNPETREFIRNLDSSSTMPFVSGSILRKLDFVIPPLNEQKAIASVLSSLDDKIDLLHRQNRTLEAMAETLFRQWFIEEADESWRTVKLGEFIITNQETITGKNAPDIIKYLDTSSLNEGNFDDFVIYNFCEAPSRARRRVCHNDILISTVRPNQKHFGIIKHPDDHMIVSTGFCVITCKNINPHFAYLLLTTEDMTEYLHSIAEGSTSTYPSLKPSDIESIEFSLPPEKKMNEFSKLSERIWDKIENNFIKIKTLEKLRDTSLPKLMSGEVRVKL